MFKLLQSVAAVGFVLWGIYKGYWVCRKVYRFLKTKYENWAAEEAYVNMLAAQIRYEREHGSSAD